MAEAIQIQVNGEERGCPADATVGDLLRELAIKTERVAVELNLEILDRKEFDQRDRKSTRLNSSHLKLSRMPSSA